MSLRTSPLLIARFMSARIASEIWPYDVGNRYLCNWPPEDVSRLGDIDKVYQTIREQKGKLDILFANAGIGERGRAEPADFVHRNHL